MKATYLICVYMVETIIRHQKGQLNRRNCFVFFFFEQLKYISHKLRICGFCCIKKNVIFSIEDNEGMLPVLSILIILVRSSPGSCSPLPVFFCGLSSSQLRFHFFCQDTCLFVSGPVNAIILFVKNKKKKGWSTVMCSILSL